MVSHFGFPARGVSPYATRLAESLEATRDVVLERFPIRQAYPDWLNPAAQPHAASAGGLHYARRGTWEACARGSFQILHLQYWTLALAPCFSRIARRVRRAGKAVVVTVHNPSPHESLPLADKFESAFLEMADLLIVHSQQGLDILRARFPRSKGVRIHHGVDVPKDMSGERGDVTPKDLLFFGNLRPYKGVDILVGAWMTLKDDYPDSTLTVAGRSWKGRNACSRLMSRFLFRRQPMDESGIAALSVNPSNRLRLIEGYLSEEEIDRLCLTSRIGIFPYRRFTGQSGAAARAAGLGLPVLVSETGALADFAIAPEFVIPPDDAGELAAALRMMMRFNGDDYWELRRRQRKVAASMSWMSAARRHAEVYADLVP